MNFDQGVARGFRKAPIFAWHVLKISILETLHSWGHSKQGFWDPLATSVCSCKPMTVITAIGFVRLLGFWVGHARPLQMWYGVIWYQHNGASGRNERKSHNGKSRPEGDPGRQLYCLPGGARQACIRQSRVCYVDTTGWSGSSGHSTRVHKIKQTWWTLHVFCKDSWVCIKGHKNNWFLNCHVHL